MKTRNINSPYPGNGEGGYALFAVTMFVFVVIIGSVAVFSTSSSETMLTHHELEKTQAFFLADGAVERARARLSNDLTWRDGWANQAMGGGTYSLTISDTTINSVEGVTILADGVVGNVRRRLEVIAQTPPVTEEYAAYAGGGLVASGHIFADPGIHVRSDYWLSDGASELQRGEITTGPYPTPPMMHTEPAYWPDSTVYQVVPALSGSTPVAMVYDRDGNDVTSTMSRSLSSVMSYDAATETFTYDFTGHSDVSDWFDFDSGVFARGAGDATVVVDFGAAAATAPNHQARSDVYLNGFASVDLQSTIVNTRFIGSTEVQRLDSNYWMGGGVHVEHIDLTPANGVSVVAHEFTVEGPRVFMGRNDAPALIYATSDFVSVQNTDHLDGSIVALGDLILSGTHHYNFDDDMFALFPNQLITTWPGNGGVMLNIVSWREIPMSDG